MRACGNERRTFAEERFRRRNLRSTNLSIFGVNNREFAGRNALLHMLRGEWQGQVWLFVVAVSGIVCLNANFSQTAADALPSPGQLAPVRTN